MSVLRNIGVILFGASLIITMSGFSHAKEKVIAYTGYLPPLSINSHQKGIAVELMELVAEEADIDLDIRFTPWKRAQVLTQNTPGSLIFSMAATKERFKTYDYIAPLIYTESAFVTLDQPINTFENAVATGKVIGVHRGSQRSKILQRNGLVNLAEVSSPEQITAMLHVGRIDAWYTMSVRASYMMKKLGHNPERLIIGSPLSHGMQWLAANKDIDPELKARLSSAISKVWRDPRYWQIVDGYAK
ncbi:MAG: transporter substrate-binding domain-containing protein [Roseibium sp.]